MVRFLHYAKHGARLPSAFRAVIPPLIQPHERIISSRDAALRRLIAHAYHKVPYYRELFKRNRITPQEIQRAADLERIPISTKDNLRNIPAKMTMARGVDPSRLLEIRTSGTSGTPFTVRCTHLEDLLLRMTWLRPLWYFGRKIQDKVAVIIYARPELHKKNPIHERIRRTLGIFPTLNIDMSMPPERILKMIRWYRPDMLGAYPGVLSRLAELVTKADRREIEPHTIWTGGEMLTEPVRQRIASAFGTRVFNVYASEEFKMIGWECRETGDFHICNSHLIVEILHEDGRPAMPGERGEVVVTSLISYSMPFIRYRLGDVVTQGDSVCRCGLPYSTIRELAGRTMEYFKVPDGGLVHPYDIVRIILNSGEWIRTHQLVQERRDRIVLWVEPFESAPPGAVRNLTQNICRFLGPEIEFEVIPVDHIEPDPSGKLRFARSLVH